MKKKVISLLIVILIIFCGVLSAIVIFQYNLISKLETSASDFLDKEDGKEIKATIIKKKVEDQKEVFNQEDWSWESATLSAPWAKRDAHTVSVFKDKMWLIGGVGGIAPDYSQNKSDIWVSKDG